MQQAWRQLSQDPESQSAHSEERNDFNRAAEPNGVISSRGMVWTTIAFGLCCALAVAASTGRPVAMGVQVGGEGLVQLRKASTGDNLTPVQDAANETKKDLNVTKAANSTKKHGKKETRVETILNGEFLLVAKDFKADEDIELSVKIGDVVQEMSKEVNGWKVVQRVGANNETESGYVPTWAVKAFNASNSSVAGNASRAEKDAKGKKHDQEKTSHAKKH